MKNLKDFPYKTSFSAEIKCLVSPDTDKFLSLASLDNLKFLIPQQFIDNQGIDLLPVAYNAAVANRCNVNGDAIDTATAIDICKNFIHRPVDIEHKPLEICGHIINAGFTTFGTDKELSLDQVKDLNDPFNLALASYIYARNYIDLAEAIEEAADPDSLKFASISASWELLFKNYKIVKGPRNLSEATIIDDPDEIKRLEPMLQINKGTGKDKEGNFIYRLITGEVYASGIGLTKRPAAQVKGIFVPGITDKEEKSTANIELIDIQTSNSNDNSKIIEENTKNNFQNIETPVINYEYMKLTTIEEVKALTDETLKTCNASDLNNVLSTELAKASEKISAERKEKETAIAEAGATAKTLAEVQKELAEVKANQSAAAADATFNTRMASLDETYKLDASYRKIIAKQIKDLDEAGFTAWASDFETLAADKKKAKADDDESDASKKDKADKDKADMDAKAAKDKEDKDKADKEKADKDKSDAEKKSAIASDARTLLDGLKKTVAAVIPNTVSTSETLVEKYSKAFGKDQVIIKQRR